MKKQLIFLSVALLILLGIFIVWMVVGVRNQPQSSETGSLEILTGTRTDTMLQHMSPLGSPSAISFGGEGEIVSRTRRMELGMTVSAVTPPDGFGTMLLLETSEGSRVLADPDQIRNAPSLSFDGTHVAYAELALPFGETLFSENVLDWHVYLMDVASGEREDLGVGYAPHFIAGAPNVLMYSTPDGIASRVVDGSEEMWLSEGHPVSLTDQAVVASPDGGHLAAYNPLTRQYTIYKVTQSYPLQLSAIGEPQFEFEQVALSNSHLFGTTYNSGDGTYTLWRIPNEKLDAPFSEGGEALYIFADGQIPYQLIP